MKIIILSIGARPKPETAALMHDFTKRLPKHIQVQWRYLKHGQGSPLLSKKQEAELILRALPQKSNIILLDEVGKQLSSPQLSKELFKNSQDTTFIIGGAYGVDDMIRKKSNVIWSLGKLVYPHQLVRIIVSEQIYRAHSINTGHPYHHS